MDVARAQTEESPHPLPLQRFTQRITKSQHKDLSELLAGAKAPARTLHNANRQIVSGQRLEPD